MAKVDLVVVGGGIAGSAIAGRMSAAAASVLVLEQTEQFVDRVRGEYVAPWGVREVIALGLWDVVSSVEHCNVFTRFVGFEERIPEVVAIGSMRDFKLMVPDVPGAFGVSHPGLSEALLAHAASCGADVVRGTSSVSVEPGDRHRPCAGTSVTRRSRSRRPSSSPPTVAHRRLRHGMWAHLARDGRHPLPRRHARRRHRRLAPRRRLPRRRR